MPDGCLEKVGLQNPSAELLEVTYNSSCPC